MVQAKLSLSSKARLDEITRCSARYAGPTYYLLCHGIELALKSYLAASGVSEDALRKLRHDLKRALRDAQRRGFVPADDRFPEIVKWLTPYHLDHFFRYPRTPSGAAPSVSVAGGCTPDCREDGYGYRRLRTGQFLEM